MKKPHIISYSDDPFRNRVEAGKLLGQELRRLGCEGGVVLGIPRGGIIVAQEVAGMLEADLDVVLSRKLGAPNNPELAIGAIAEDGKLFLDETMVLDIGVTDFHIQQESNHQLIEIEHRKKLIRSIQPKVSLQEKLVIVTDDGVATGSTMQAALWAVRQEGPKKLIAAIPVGPKNTLIRLATDADRVICLRVPAFFDAVGRFYVQFGQIGDEEVLEVLENYYANRGEK